MREWRAVDRHAVAPLNKLIVADAIRQSFLVGLFYRTIHNHPLFFVAARLHPGGFGGHFCPSVGRDLIHGLLSGLITVEAKRHEVKPMEKVCPNPQGEVK